MSKPCVTLILRSCLALTVARSGRNDLGGLFLLARRQPRRDRNEHGSVKKGVAPGTGALLVGEQ